MPGAIGRNRSASSAVAVRRGSITTMLGAALAPVLQHALEQHRMAPGGVGADQHDQVGLVEILVQPRHRVGAEGAAMAGDRRRHAEPRIGVDIRRADEALHQLVGDVIVLGEQLAREIERDRVRPVALDDAREALRDLIERRVPAGAHERAADQPAQHRMQQARRRARASRRAPSPSSTAGRNSPDARDRRRSPRRRRRPASRARRSRRRNRGRWCASRRSGMLTGAFMRAQFTQ